MFQKFPVAKKIIKIIHRLREQPKRKIIPAPYPLYISSISSPYQVLVRSYRRDRRSKNDNTTKMTPNHGELWLPMFRAVVQSCSRQSYSALTMFLMNGSLYSLAHPKSCLRQLFSSALYLGSPAMFTFSEGSF